MFVLLFAFTGSAVIPIKAMAMSALSLAAALGIVAGLIVITRLTNGLLLLLVPGWRVSAWSQIGGRIEELWQRRGGVLAMSALAAAFADTGRARAALHLGPRARIRFVRLP